MGTIYKYYLNYSTKQNKDINKFQTAQELLEFENNFPEFRPPCKDNQLKAFGKYKISWKLLELACCIIN